MNYDSQDVFQERMMNEKRRMEARLDGFMRTHANRNNRIEQPRVRTREGRRVCDICGRVGHVRQNCYVRVDQRNQYQNPRNTQPRRQIGPRIAALEADGTAEPVVAQFNQPNHQQKKQEAQPEGAYYARRSNPPIFASTEIPRISTIQAVQPINYNEARARDILKTEFSEPAPNSNRHCHSDQTYSTFHPQQSQEKATEPETYTETKPDSSEKVIVMTTSRKENLQVKNATQTVATHSDPAEEDQVRIISSDERYTIADDSLQSAPDQEPTHQRQELSSSNQETRVHSISNRNTQGSAMHKKVKPTQRSFPPNTPQRTAFVIGKINDCPTKLLIDS